MFRYKFSTREVSDAMLDVLLRFPLVVLAALLAAYLAIGIIEQDFKDSTKALIKGVMVCGMAVPFLISLKLFSESRGLSKTLEWGLQIIGAALMVLYWWTLPTDLDYGPMKHLYRYAALMLAAHLLVSFAPFTRKGHNTEFWDYNQNLFFRWLIGVVYAAVLFGGIAAALGAINVLFNVRIKGERFGDLWVLCAAVFHPLFFLAGVPRTFASEDDALNYPKMLRWFCVYILVPIVLIYLAILYAYFGKIGIEWHFPRGWVANLGLGFSVTGILAVLLIFPAREREDQPFIRLYYRWYFVLLVPVIVLLFLAIGKRLSQYGFTEERYAVLALCVWLAFVAAYFIGVSRHRIKILPMTLFVVAMVSAFGPWGMSGVSRASQTARLKHFLREANVLGNDGKIVKAADTIADSTNVEISLITKYLVETHGLKSMQPYFNKPVDSIVKSKSKYEQPQALVGEMGLQFQYYYGEAISEANYYSYNARQNRRFDIAGYDAMVMLNYYGGNAPLDTIHVSDNALTISYDDDKNVLVKLPDGSNLKLDVNDLVTKLNAKYGFAMPEENAMILYAAKDTYRFKLQIQNTSGRKVDGKFVLDGYDAYLLAGYERKPIPD